MFAYFRHVLQSIKFLTTNIKKTYPTIEVYFTRKPSKFEQATRVDTTKTIITTATKSMQRKPISCVLYETVKLKQLKL